MRDNESAVFELDRRALRWAFERAAVGYDQAAVAQREVGQRLLERLDQIKLDPAVILDVGCATGATTALLFKKYRRARIVGLEQAVGMVAVARKRAPWLRTLYGAVGEPEALPLADASCDLIFSNLALPWCFDLDRAFSEFRRVLKPGGALLFSTLGPDTLLELRRAWHSADRYPRVHAFLDLHDVGDALLRAGLTEPVMDVERLNFTYSELDGLLRDLKALGAGNLNAGRPRGLTGKGRWRAMRAAYEQWRAPDGTLPATCEVVYGHAWGSVGERVRRLAAGPAVFPLERLRRSRPDRE